MMDGTLIIGKHLISVFAAIAVVLVVGSGTPLPGIAPEFIAGRALGDVDRLPERFSILALGLTPILNGVAIGEICRLLFQWCPPPENEARWTAAWTAILTRLMVLAVAALQGFGVAEALEAAGALKVGVVAPKLVIVLTVVASTAALLWLSECIKVSGLRHGVWQLWSASFFLSLPANLAGSVEATRVGAMPEVNWLLSTAYIVLSAGAVVAVNLFWVRSLHASGRSRERENSDVLSIFVWPIFLSSYVGGYVLMLLLLLAGGHWQPSGIVLKAAASLTIAVLIPIFVFAYARLHSKTLQAAPSGRSAIYSAAAIIAAMEIVLFLLGSFLVEIADLPLSVNGVLLIVVVTVFLALANDREVTELTDRMRAADRA